MQTKRHKFFLMNTKYKPLEDMVTKLQILGGKTKPKYHKKLSEYYD